MKDLAAPQTRAIGLETVGMTKVFGPLVALDDVSINVAPGSFHALLGENGAGKSTLVKCILGFYQPTRGTILVNGAEARIPTPAAARDIGIGMVYQHFTLVPCLSVAENLVMERLDADSRRPCEAAHPWTVDRTGGQCGPPRRLQRGVIGLLDHPGFVPHGGRGDHCTGGLPGR